MKWPLSDLVIATEEIGLLELTVDGEESLKHSVKLGVAVMIPHILMQITVFVITDFLVLNVKWFLIEFRISRPPMYIWWTIDKFYQ